MDPRAGDPDDSGAPSVSPVHRWFASIFTIALLALVAVSFPDRAAAAPATPVGNRRRCPLLYRGMGGRHRPLHRRAAPGGRPAHAVP